MRRNSIVSKRLGVNVRIPGGAGGDAGPAGSTRAAVGAYVS